MGIPMIGHKEEETLDIETNEIRTLCELSFRGSPHSIMAMVILFEIKQTKMMIYQVARIPAV